MTTTDIAARRLIRYFDADELGEMLAGQPVTTNRPHLAGLIDDLRLALEADDMRTERNER